METKQGLHAVHQEVGETSHSLSFLAWELLLASNFPPGTEQCWLGGWDFAGKIKLSSFSSCVVIFCFFLSFFFFTVLLKFLKWTTELSQAISVHR